MSGIPATLVSKRPKIGVAFEIDVAGHVMYWRQMDIYATTERCERAWRPLNGENDNLPVMEMIIPQTFTLPSCCCSVMQVGL